MDSKSTVRVRHRSGTAARAVSKESKKRSAGEIKLFICCLIFLVAFLIKTLFPEFSEQIRSDMLPVLESNMNYEAAFASMGSFFAGEISFPDAFGSMMAFFISGSDAIKTATEDLQSFPEPDRDSKGVDYSGIAMHRLESPPFITPIFSSAEVADSLPGSEADSSSATPPEVFPGEHYETPTVSSADTPEDTYTDIVTEAQASVEISAYTDINEDAVASFIYSQSLYNGFEIPEDVVTERLVLPFDYTPPVGVMISSSGFGYREHPIGGDIKFHYGIDIDAAVGDSVYAFSDGHIAATGWSEELGNYLIVSHGDGYITHYFHCDSLLAELGERVAMGDKIAEAGETGYVTGAHLHFELLFNGFYLNPDYYI